MEKKKTKVFITGATGVMGFAGLKELMAKPEEYSVTALVRHSKKNVKKLSGFISSGLNVVWGHLLDRDSLSEGIKDADIVLHVGGMVSPLAEHFPEETLKVNVGSMRLIAEIVKSYESDNPERIIKVVYIGSVSQYGPNMPPHQWANVCHTQTPAKFDAYAESKILAEKVLREAGLRCWVSLRQTAIIHSGLLTKIDDPVIFHTPLKGVLEWVTVEDSGRLLERVCRQSLPDSFWNKAYNVGGGEKFRLINMEFETKLMKALHCPPPQKIFETNWFATGNFHGVWFEDSDQLDDILHFRADDSFDKALSRLTSELPFYYKLAPLAPAFIIKSFLHKVARKAPLGPLSWIEDKDKAKIDAFFGSMKAYKEIPDWHNFSLPVLSRVTPKKSGTYVCDNDKNH